VRTNHRYRLDWPAQTIHCLVGSIPTIAICLSIVGRHYTKRATMGLLPHLKRAAADGRTIYEPLALEGEILIPGRGESTAFSHDGSLNGVVCTSYPFGSSYKPHWEGKAAIVFRGREWADTAKDFAERLGLPFRELSQRELDKLRA
jgi:hypothetical protein